MYIEKINNPNDLKKLSAEECKELASEIRGLLLDRASKIGGHVGSNLGMVEATIALHYVFNSPVDKFVFDVSHQSYTHKILTGRKYGFLDSDRYSEISGYTNPDESEHDLFQVGHTATSISLASGLAKARDIRGTKENIIAVIGDGSMSGGEALEGLDFSASELKSNFIVLFNDNGMSIADNHGGIYKNFADLKVGKGSAADNMFKALGYEYIFVDDGNDVEKMISVFQKVKDTDHPVVIHMATTKGKGYEPAEHDKEAWHWRRPFDLETGELKSDFNGERYDRVMRDHLLEKMAEDPEVVTMIAAVPDSLNFTSEHRKKAGKQFVDVGIAEEHAVAMAAGLARNGCKPVFATMSTFFQRTYDQISQELCINNCPATLLVINASVYSVNDVTHIGIFDIPMMSNIPNLVYLAPTNKQEYLAMVDWSIDQKEHPVAIRAPRNGVFYADGEVDKDYSSLNKYKITKNGEKIAVLALGDFYQMGEELVASMAESFGISATLVNPRYITGVDSELLSEIEKNHDLVITLEDGVVDGGWGQKIASFYGTSDIKVMNYGLKKEFIDRYNLNEVMEKNHLCVDLIVEDIKNLRMF
ncbi:1-deoxy-D-xylulose-5-phosphate synthase [Butyrivibrio sp. AC2005]|uniref:1-deoxy-D-xylulose-5-phosphate synthase n=1 Tax=Butyrivibrio sp. AC2005 TaxID=1280672 RepID=UPI00040D2539|nr:1-deoxy-D-xylulose-5-phosphate synthase [Butyrivibrio sp. AC2005]